MNLPLRTAVFGSLFLLAGVVLAWGFVVLDDSWLRAHPVDAAMLYPQWEHFVSYPERDGLFQLESEPDYLTRMGRNGWELCTVQAATPSGRAFYFKRKRQP